MCYFGVENLNNLCKLIAYGSQPPRSTQQRAEDRGYKKNVLVIIGIVSNMQFFLTVLVPWLQQILPKLNSISFSYLVSEVTWLHGKLVYTLFLDQ